MGGTISVSICSALLHSSLDKELPAILSGAEINLLKTSFANLNKLPPSKVAPVMEVYGHAYNRQFRVLIAFAGANLLVAACLVVVMRRKDRTNKIQASETNVDYSNDVEEKPPEVVDKNEGKLAT
jgi:hypothetical protein